MKEIWIGVLRGIGTLASITLGSWLIARIPAVREWVTPRILPLGAPEKASLTIFLAVLSLALLGLWIWTRVSLSKQLKRLTRKPDIETQFVQDVEIQRGPKTRGEWAAFCPKCHLPLAVSYVDQPICCPGCDWVSQKTHRDLWCALKVWNK